MAYRTLKRIGQPKQLTKKEKNLESSLQKFKEWVWFDLQGRICIGFEPEKVVRLYRKLFGDKSIDRAHAMLALFKAMRTAEVEGREVTYYDTLGLRKRPEVLLPSTIRKRAEERAQVYREIREWKAAGRPGLEELRKPRNIPN